MSDIRETLNQRGANYGKFMDNAEISEALYRVVRDVPGWQEFLPDQKVATWIIFQKLARALSGRAQYDDNWRDIAGYAQLIVDRINGTGTYTPTHQSTEFSEVGGELEPVPVLVRVDPDQVWKVSGTCRGCGEKVGNAHKPDCETVG